MPIFVLILAFSISSFPAGAADLAVAGVIAHLQGAGFVNRRDSSENLHKELPVREGDRIVTGHNSRVLLKMTDGTLLTLGSDTEFAINRYRYAEPSNRGSAALELIKGVFRAVTGAIGKSGKPDFRVKTAVGTIGIRGTDFWGGFYFSQGLDVALLGGKGIFIENSAGRVEITSAGEGTTVASANEPPSAPKRWGEKKLNAAMESVALIPEQ